MKDKYVRRPTKAGSHLFLILSTFTFFFLSSEFDIFVSLHSLIINLKDCVNKPVSHRKYHRNATFYSQRNTDHKTPSPLLLIIDYVIVDLQGFAGRWQSICFEVDQSRFLLKAEAETFLKGTRRVATCERT